MLLLSACEAASDEEAAPVAGPPPVAVTSLTLSTQTIPLHYDYVGQLKASLEVDIRSRITGVIERQHFTEGHEVKAGQVLFSLDAALFEAEYEQALAAIENARAQKLTAQAQLKKAQRELDRVTPLASQQMLSENLKDDAASSVDIAQAQLAVADAAIRQAEANKLTAEINLRYTRIRAPANGIIGRAEKQPGALVSAGSDSLLTNLVQIDPIQVEFGIPQNDVLSRQQRLDQGVLQLDEDGWWVDILDQQGAPGGYRGQIDFQDVRVDQQTGSVATRARLDNAAGRLLPGQFVRLRLGGITQPDALAIPQRAVLDGPAGKYVYVAEQSERGGLTALQKPVTLGEWVHLDGGRDHYWIVTSGLEPGDRVIVDGVARIFFSGHGRD